MTALPPGVEPRLLWGRCYALAHGRVCIAWINDAPAIEIPMGRDVRVIVPRVTGWRA